MTLIAFLFAAVMGKLIYIQIINSKNLQIKALDQWTRDIPVVGERGDIFDRNGELWRIHSRLIPYMSVLWR